MPKPDQRISMPRRTSNLYSAFDITPAQIKAAVINAESGSPEYYFEILDRIKGAFGDLETRKLALLSFGRTIKGQNEEQMKFIEAALKRIDYFGLVSLWQDSIYYGFKLIEIYFQTDGGKILPTGFDGFENRYLRSANLTDKKPSDAFYTKGKKLLTDVLLQRNEDGTYRYLNGMPGQLLIADYGDLSYNNLPVDFTRMGYGKLLMILYIMNFYNIQDWSSFNELFGMPIRIGKYDDNTTSEQLDDLEEATHDLGSDASAVIHRSTDIELKEAQKYGSINTYDTFDAVTEKKISRILLGETLTSSNDKTGSYAMAKVHNGVRLEKTLSDARYVSAGLTEQLIQPLLAYNFSSPDKTIELSHGVEEIEKILMESNQLIKAQTYRELFDMGTQITEGQLQREFKLDAAKDGEAVIKKQATGLAGLLGS